MPPLASPKIYCIRLCCLGPREEQKLLFQHTRPFRPSAIRISQSNIFDFIRPFDSWFFSFITLQIMANWMNHTHSLQPDWVCRLNFVLAECDSMFVLFDCDRRVDVCVYECEISKNKSICFPIAISHPFRMGYKCYSHEFIHAVYGK